MFDKILNYFDKKEEEEEKEQEIVLDIKDVGPIANKNVDLMAADPLSTVPEEPKGFFKKKKVAPPIDLMASSESATPEVNLNFSGPIDLMASDPNNLDVEIDNVETSKKKKKKPEFVEASGFESQLSGEVKPAQIVPDVNPDLMSMDPMQMTQTSYMPPTQNEQNQIHEAPANNEVSVVDAFSMSAPHAFVPKPAYESLDDEFSKTQKICTSCGTPNDPLTKFCVSCGKEFN